MLEDNIRAATQTVMITNQLEGNKPPGKKSIESKEGQSRDRKRSVIGHRKKENSRNSSP